MVSQCVTRTVAECRGRWTSAIGGIALTARPSCTGSMVPDDMGRASGISRFLYAIRPGSANFSPQFHDEPPAVLIQYIFPTLKANDPSDDVFQRAQTLCRSKSAALNLADVHFLWTCGYGDQSAEPRVVAGGKPQTLCEMRESSLPCCGLFQTDQGHPGHARDSAVPFGPMRPFSH